MMNDKEALKVFESCVNEMYEASTPPTTWADIKKKYGDTGQGRSSFYLRHSISEEDYNRIKIKYCKRLNAYYERQLAWFLLDYAPTFKKEE